MKPTSHFIELEGLKSHYVQMGTGNTTVLLIHGDMRTSRSFDALSRKLALTHTVTAMDLFGHGNSDWPFSGYRFIERSHNIENFMNNVFDGHADTVVAHSTGGIALALYAARKPSAFNFIVLLEPMITVDEKFQRMVSSRETRPRTTWSNKEELTQVLSKHEVTKKWTSEVIKDVVEHETFINEDGRLDMKWATQTLSWKDRDGDYFDLLPTLQKLKVPTLFMASEDRQSIFQPVKELSRIKNNIHFCTVMNTGHNMYMERPQAVATLIKTLQSGHPIPEEI